MKKIILAIFISVFVCCNIARIEPQGKAQAHEHHVELEIYPLYDSKSSFTSFKRIIIDNMSYGLFQSSGGNSYAIPFVINLTKDSLEVALLRRNLKK